MDDIARSFAAASSIAPLKDDYLADIAADLDKEPEKPKKKTKAQKRAERKERKRLQAIDDKKLILRDKLKRELELSKHSQVMHLKDWEQMCSELKVLELREELLQWSEEANRNFERKNTKIELLLEDMDETMAQQQKLHSRSVDLINYIQRCYHELVNSTKRIYEMQADELLHDYYREIKRRMEELDFMHENSENIMHASNVIDIRTLREEYNIYLHKRDDVTNTGIEQRFVIRDQIVNKMKQMHQQLITFVDALTNTELDAHKYERIRLLTDRQMAFMEESKKLAVEEARCVAKLNDLRTAMLNADTENESRENDLRLEMTYFQGVRAKLEQEAKIDRDTTRDKLRILTTESYEVCKFLDKIMKSGELLLSLSANCRKLQTESEKIMLGGEPVDAIELEKLDENFKLKTLNLSEHVDMTEEAIVEQNQFMRNFWRRQAMVEAQNMLLLEEKLTLTKENEKYINFIKSMSKTEQSKDLIDLLKVQSVEDQPFPDKISCLDYKLPKHSL